MNEYTIKLAKPHCHNCGKIKVKDPIDGKTKFINKARTEKIAAELASNTTQSLKQRLQSAVVMMEKETDEDI